MNGDSQPLVPLNPMSILRYTFHIWIAAPGHSNSGTFHALKASINI